MFLFSLNQLTDLSSLHTIWSLTVVSSIPFILSFTGFLLAVVAARSCHFISSQNEVDGLRYWGIFQFDVGDDVPCLNFNFRVFRYEQSDEGLPESYELSQEDFRIAQIGAMLATGTSCVVTLLLFISFFRNLPYQLFKYVNAVLLLASVAGCGMTFQLFGIYWCGEGEFFDDKSGLYRDMNGRCFMEGGGERMTAAMGIFFITAITLVCMDAPSVPMVEFTRYEIVSAEDVELPATKNRLISELERTRIEIEEEQVPVPVPSATAARELPNQPERLY